jgi:hypothetical protein
MQIACASARGLLSVPREVGPLFEHAAAGLVAKDAVHAGDVNCGGV